MRLHGDKVAAIAATLTLATGGGVAWACGAGHGDPGRGGTTGYTGWTGATGTTGSSGATTQARRHTRRHAHRNTPRHSRRA